MTVYGRNAGEERVRRTTTADDDKLVLPEELGLEGRERRRTRSTGRTYPGHGWQSKKAGERGIGAGDIKGGGDPSKGTRE